jgi:cytochrome c peroxidase
MKRWVVLVAAVLLLLLAVPVLNLFAGKPSVDLAEAASVDPSCSEAASILAEKCGHCHVDGTTLPFYARLPGARALMRKDIEEALDRLDLVEGLNAGPDGPVSEVMLAKTEYVIHYGSMPPMRYRLLHWTSGLGDSVEAKLLAWIRDEREEHFATDDVAPLHRHDVLQPLPLEVRVDDRKVALGRALFHDPRLSGDDTVSCATCHALDKGGTDRKRFSQGIGGRKGDINSPTVYNSGFQFRQFWDGRASDLEEQAHGPVNNPVEMGGSWPDVIENLKRDEAFAAEFAEVYPGGLTSDNIVHAIAEFERSLVTPNGRFDRFLRGDDGAMSEDEKEGHRLFVAIGCAICHAGKLAGGRSFEIMGLEDDYFAARGHAGRADQGRFNVTSRDRDRHRFKVPTLRNVPLTYPYFHDGAVDDLAEAVRVMARYQRGHDLAVRDVDRIVRFLEALIGEYDGKPLG